MSAGMTLTAAAAESGSPKEEVIYVMTDAGANVKDVYAVNIYNGGKITDYGDYSDVKLLNVDGDVSVNSDLISFESDAAKVYLQGKMDDCEIPWDISIEYFLDGEEITPEKLAGKSGDLEIRFRVSENSGSRPGFYDGYALQASFTLDTDLCENIGAPGATVANVGKKKQITYTILPGNGIDTVISADVHDFEMDPASINGVRLNLDIDIDKSGFTGEAEDLEEGIEKVDSGAEELNGGVSELKTGGDSLREGADKLSGGAAALDSGISSLSEGIAELGDGVDELDKKSDDLTGGSKEVKDALFEIKTALSDVSSDTDKIKELTDASGEIGKAINSLSEGAQELYQNAGYDKMCEVMAQNGLDVGTLTEGNKTAVEEIEKIIKKLTAAKELLGIIPGHETEIEQITQLLEGLQTVVTLINGNSAYIAGTETYLNSLSDGARELRDGLAKLETNYGQFNDSVTLLAGTLSETVLSMSNLASAINTLFDSYTELDNGIGEYTGGVAKIAAGFGKLRSGVAELSGGSKELVTGCDELSAGAEKLSSGLDELSGGSQELSGGTGELKDATDGLSTEIGEKIDGIIDDISGDSGEETVSFVSDKNKSVSSVQFVIKTDAVKIPEDEAESAETTKKLTFWQKFLKLFGLYKD